MLLADVIYKEIEQPQDRKCDCGHLAPAHFKRNGSEYEEELTKFFKVSGLISGIYCEPCLMIVNYMAKRKRDKYE